MSTSWPTRHRRVPSWCDLSVCAFGASEGKARATLRGVVAVAGKALRSHVAAGVAAAACWALCPRCLQGGAVHLGGGAFLHPAGEVADAEPLDGGGGIEVEVAGTAGHVAGVGAVEGLENEHGVFHAAGHGAEFV